MDSSNVNTERAIWKGLSFPPPLHGIIFFLVTTFGSCLQLKYQFGNATQPVEHSNTMQAFFVALCVYSALLAIEYELQSHDSRHLANIKRITLLLGVLLVILLILILFPIYGWFTFSLWVIYLVRVLLSCYQEYSQLLTQRMLDAWKRKFTREETQLPVSM